MEPFFTTKTAGEGTGLGLSLVYSILTDLGGTLDLESDEGVGTKVTVRLPRAEAIPA
jgi:signal transduction histidine kinase